MTGITTKVRFSSKIEGILSKKFLWFWLGDYVEQVKRDDPEQFIAIGYLGNTLLSVIYEIRYDEEGEYIWLVTYWKSTKREREIYEQYFY